MYIKVMFKVMLKIAKIARPNFFFDPPKNKKSLGPKSSAIWDLWRTFIFKIDLRPPGTPKPPQNAFLLQQNWFLDGFGVPGGCK